MANSDYEKRGSGSVCPSARLSTALKAEGDPTVIVVSNYTSAGNVQPAVGMGVLIDDEICRVTSVDLPNVGLARGCADTIPAKHLYGAKVWFFTAGYGTDDRQYPATVTLGVKALVKSTSAAMEVQNSPPNAVTFLQRFARPYPPGNFKINGLAFSNEALILNDAEETDELVLTWSHRDRITQGDTLQGHEIGNIGPEAGTTYTIKAYTPDGTLVKTVTGITGTTWSYSVADARADFELTDTPVYDARITLESVREGFPSWQIYESYVDIINRSGWGHLWGMSFGKKT